MKSPSPMLIYWMWVLASLITNLKQIYIVNPLIAISFSTLILLIHFTTKHLLFTVRDPASEDCSSPLTFQKDLENFKTWFCKTGYPLREVDALFKGASKKGLGRFFERPDRRDTDVALVMIYQILYAEEKSREFLHLPYLSHFVSSLRNRLVRAKVYPLTRTKGGKRYIFCWTSWCKTCSNIKQTDTFGSFVTMKVYKINYSFKCDSKCLIYLFSSKFCGIQCAGSSVDSFWWNNYKSCQRNAAALEEHATKTISISNF